MRRVDRASVAAPTVLVGPKSRGVIELEKATKYYAQSGAAQQSEKKTTTSAFKFSAYSDEAVKNALEKIFYGKCAYCESRYANQAPVDVEHYRPKGGVADKTEHPGYWWLAMAWDNLLPSCIDCNRRRWQDLPPVPSSLEQLLKAPDAKEGRGLSGKQDIFPVAGNRAFKDPVTGEMPDLINPCVDDPDAHLSYYIDRTNPLGLILPKYVDGIPSRRGLASIHVYGLNRLGLVQERTRVLRTLEFLAVLIDEIDEMAEKLLSRRAKTDKAMGTRLSGLSTKILDEITAMSLAEQPYSSLVRAWAKSLKT